MKSDFRRACLAGAALGLSMALMPPAGSAASSSKPPSTAAKPKLPLVSIEVVVAAKQTTISDDRFTDFRSAQVENKGHRTATSFLVEWRPMTSAGATKLRLVARLGFSIAATEAEYPLYLTNCAPPRANAPINGIVWLLSNDGLQIEAVSPIWGKASCFGSLG